MVDINQINNPDDRARIAKVLRQKAQFTDAEVEQIVDLCLQLAPELIKIWQRVTSKNKK